MLTMLVVAASLVIGWVLPLLGSVGAASIVRLVQARFDDEGRDRLYFSLKYGFNGAAILASALLLFRVTSLPDVTAWPVWVAFGWSAVAALSAMYDADRQRWIKRKFARSLRATLSHVARLGDRKGLRRRARVAPRSPIATVKYTIGRFRFTLIRA